jgi:hypothetical protein
MLEYARELGDCAWVRQRRFGPVGRTQSPTGEFGRGENSHRSAKAFSFPLNVRPPRSTSRFN